MIELIAGAALALQPAPSRSQRDQYLIYYPPGGVAVPAASRAVIDEAVVFSSQQPQSRVIIRAHTDKSGSAASNRRLAVKRGASVAEELVRRGIDRGRIEVQALGESDPPVPTADGVGEPLNRLVHIHWPPGP